MVKGKNNLMKTVLISTFRAENNQFLMTRKKNVKANPPGDAFVSAVSSSRDFHIITESFFRSLICRAAKGIFSGLAHQFVVNVRLLKNVKII